MKKFVQENKLTFSVIVFSLALYGGITFVSKPLVKTAEAPVEKPTIVNVEGVKMYNLTGEAKTGTDNESILKYSLSFPSSLVRETKNEGRNTLFYYNGVTVANLTFIYQDTRVYTPIEYVKELLGKKIPLAIEENKTKIGSYSYVSAGAESSYFRVTSFHDGKWLGALEILSDNQALEKILLTSLKVQ